MYVSPSLSLRVSLSISLNLKALCYIFTRGEIWLRIVISARQILYYVAFIFAKEFYIAFYHSKKVNEFMFSWCSSGIIPEILTIYFNIKNKIKDSHI